MKRVASGILPVISINKNIKRPLHRQIYDAYRIAIVDGVLRPAQRIPSSRELASQLSISRFPVANAYAQLIDEGYLESRVGSGTLISSSLPERFTVSESIRERSDVGHGPRPIARRTAALPRFERPVWLQGRGPFRVGQVAADQFPIRLWSNLIARRCRNINPEALDYGDRMGSPLLREMLVSYLRTARSVRCEPEQIMVVNGSQQALEISGRVLLDPGCPIWVENPGYAFAQNALALSGCKLVPVPVDREGLDVRAGIKLCRKARVAVVTPSHQFPLGMTMSAARRFELLDWAQNMGSWIIEDDFDSEFRYESAPITSLQGLDTNARVIYIGTFSKVVFPSLRLGYVVIPRDLVEQFLAVRSAMDLGPPTFYQEVLAEFISEGHFARHIRRMRNLYGERRMALVNSLNKEFGSRVEVLGDEAGLNLTIGLPVGTCDVSLAQLAPRENLRIWPLSTTYIGNASRPGFILGFGSTAATEIPRAVRKLRDLIVAG